MLSEIFWSLFLTSSIGCILAVSRMCYKSKCEKIELCGMKIDRNVVLEEKEAEFMQTHPTESKENI